MLRILNERYSPEGIALRAEIFDAEERADWDAVREAEEKLVDLKLKYAEKAR